MLIRVEHTTSFTYAEPHLGGVHRVARAAALEPAASTAPPSGSSPIRPACASGTTSTGSATMCSISRCSRITTGSRSPRSARSARPRCSPTRRASRPRSSATTTSRRRSTRRSRIALARAVASADGQGTETERAVEVMRRVRGLLVYETGATDVMTRADCRARARPRRLPGLRARDARRVPSRRDPLALRERLPLRPTSGRARSRLARLGGRARRGARLGLARPDSRSRADRGLRPRRRRSRLRDVPPTRGVWKGTTEETLEVAVRIAAL